MVLVEASGVAVILSEAQADVVTGALFSAIRLNDADAARIRTVPATEATTIGSEYAGTTVVGWGGMRDELVQERWIGQRDAVEELLDRESVQIFI